MAKKPRWEEYMKLTVTTATEEALSAFFKGCDYNHYSIAFLAMILKQRNECVMVVLAHWICEGMVRTKVDNGQIWFQPVKKYFK